MPNQHSRRPVAILLHALVWSLLAFILLLFPPLSWGIDVPLAFWGQQSLLLLMLTLIFYVNANVVVPKTLLRHRMTAFIVCIAAMVLLTQLTTYLYNEASNFRELLDKAFGSHRRRHTSIDGFVLALTAGVIGISTTLRIVQHWQRAETLRQEMEQQHTNSELAFLKAQINPHFFFNTLNNIYALTYIDVPASRESLHTLSRMMRYLLYETRNDSTLLSREISFLKDYLALMRLRLSEGTVLDVRLPEPLEDYPIAPMLLLPFVENAFKHGISAMQEGSISIAIRQEGPELDIRIRNSNHPAAYADPERSGIGLSNTRRRMALLYPDRHELETGVPEGDQYVVHLKLQLANVKA
jgi:sensor histidine kinase YesM